MNPSWRPDAPHNLVKLAVGRCLIAEMDGGRWAELALVSGAERIHSHPRLLRSLNFGDDDYDECVFDLVPHVMDEREDPRPDPWATPFVPDVAPLSLHEKFPNLVLVSDFISLPAWLAENDTKLFDRFFITDADAALPDGTLLTAAETTAALLDVAEMRRQIERIRRDHATDPEAAIGQAKELIETVCKTILGVSGGDEGSSWKFPELVKQALLHLGIDPSQQRDGDAVQVKAAQEMIGGISKVLNGADTLRNARGTGHGRSRSPLVDDSLAQLVVSSALAGAVYLANVYQAQTQTTGTLPSLADGLEGPATPSAVEVGSFVRHKTYGEGRVISVAGTSPHQTVTVEFGGVVGERKLLLHHADLSLVSP